MYKIKKCFEPFERRTFWAIQTLDGKSTGCMIWNEEFAKKILSLLNNDEN